LGGILLKDSIANGKKAITKLNKSFEEYAYEHDGINYWLARELQELLGYADWRNFLNAVDKAKESCKTNGEEVSDHFVDVAKTIPMPNGATKDVRDIKRLGASLTRFE
jgi:DNA-damage-inducible protein D